MINTAKLKACIADYREGISPAPLAQELGITVHEFLRLVSQDDRNIERNLTANFGDYLKREHEGGILVTTKRKRLTEEQWKKVREQREKGASAESLAKAYGITSKAIYANMKKYKSENTVKQAKDMKPVKNTDIQSGIKFTVEGGYIIVKIPKRDLARGIFKNVMETL